ncbi:lipopolysaccharide core biosynthesis glycosyl transferase LpsE [Gluconobacter thailandicus NBRC 3257]|uniref:Lipopolysaccharide core biosynthesis glycosyl transferase LpsE n=1 Tax=Gluconobacter thailandicus NBRC 3257 TaxID=1381097 RepID=A0ABQ0IYS1_GLUTH|nr:glycosyltransferase [Gluconobacter thailandicus]KXV52475.1 glycosyl transferase [Gluconobacter thailandicus]GAC87123.1 lipopolysaccharide core biosynthesis glycosyl transferase LpsE [Gluconobacter thailandicus NBRC 3255]GAD27356.1 lipopolysaccharide core biosynthesis glycosyl transferase LpsE [Gluconobacter thailandicus NBRC 3257]
MEKPKPSEPDLEAPRCMADREAMSVSSQPSPVAPSSPSGRKARVAHVMAGSARGGAELFFERLSMAQTADQRPVRALIRHDAGREGRLRAANVETHTFRFGGMLDVGTKPRLQKSLLEFQPDVVVAWMSRAARKLPSGPWRTAGRLGGYYDLSNYRRCEHLIGNTRGLAEWMKTQGWPADRVHYVPNFATDFASVQSARPEFLPSDAPFVLALGRLHENKAFDVLIRAMTRLPGVHLVIGGEGPERAALEDLIRKEGLSDRVHLPGWVAESGPWLRACDVMVCPSRIEPLGNVVIEGLSAGVPVVGSAIQGPQEILAGTQDGLLAPVEDADAFASQIGAILDDTALAGSLRLNGRARFEREFAESVVMTKWSEFLDGGLS